MYQKVGNETEKDDSGDPSQHGPTGYEALAEDSVNDAGVNFDSGHGQVVAFERGGVNILQ